MNYSVSKILRPNQEKNDLQNKNVKQEKFIFSLHGGRNAFKSTN